MPCCLDTLALKEPNSLLSLWCTQPWAIRYSNKIQVNSQSLLPDWQGSNVLEAFLNHLIFWTVAHFKLLARLVDPVLLCQPHSPAQKQEAQEADFLSGKLQSHLPFSTTVLGGKGPRERGQILSLDSWSSLVVQLWCLQLTHRNPGSLEFLGEAVSVVHWRLITALAATADCPGCRI